MFKRGSGSFRRSMRPVYKKITIPGATFFLFFLTRYSPPSNVQNRSWKSDGRHPTTFRTAYISRAKEQMVNYCLLSYNFFFSFLYGVYSASDPISSASQPILQLSAKPLLLNAPASFFFLLRFPAPSTAFPTVLFSRSSSTPALRSVSFSTISNYIFFFSPNVNYGYGFFVVPWTRRKR